MILQAANLFKSFGTRKVLRGLNQTLEPGEIVALIGENGAGKSTLLRILAALTKPDAGRINLDGVSIHQDPIHAKKQIGAVLHAPMVYGSLTGKENLRFFSKIFNVSNAEERIAQVLLEVNLTARADDLVRNYSRGMLQRLSIARAMLHDPMIFLMDEPLTGLDDDSILRLAQYLKKSAQQGKSVLFATHDLDRACEIATRVDVLHQGTIKDSQSTGQFTPPSLHEYYRQITRSIPKVSKERLGG